MDGTTQNFQEICIRSRATLLKMLQERGYDIKPYQNLGPDEIAKLCNNQDALQMSVSQENGQKALILYRMNKMKLSMNTFLTKLLDPEEGFEVDPKTTEVIVMTWEPVVDTFHAAALQAWSAHQLKLQFFDMRSMVNYPLDHFLQPKFEKLDPATHKEFMQEHKINSKVQLPMIRFHADMAARCLGLVPGDVVKITRSSPSAGEYILYRVCVP
jgi:DNA-directed RNA polymerase I, II, and III subunit RPABC1